MEEYITTWAKSYTPIINRHVFFIKEGDEEYMFQQILDTFVNYSKINIDDFIMKRVDRETTKNFNISFHRDDYIIDRFLFKSGVRSDELWKPSYDPLNLPVYSIVWYHNTQNIDFTGGNLEFHDHTVITPIKNKVIIFDSNDVHRVTNQSSKIGMSGIRKTTLFKFYKKT